MTSKEHLRAFIDAFLTEPQKRRCLALLETKRGREKFVNLLAHTLELDHRHVISIQSRYQNVDDIAAQLQTRGAGRICHVISENREIDGRALPLKEALSEVVGFGCGTILSCVAGRLVYYEGENIGERYLLEVK